MESRPVAGGGGRSAKRSIFGHKMGPKWCGLGPRG